MSHRLNHKKEVKMLKELAFFFPNVYSWHLCRRGPVWFFKQDKNDPAGCTPTQRIRLSRRRKKRNRQIGA